MCIFDWTVCVCTDAHIYSDILGLVKISSCIKTCCHLHTGHVVLSWFSVNITATITYSKTEYKQRSGGPAESGTHREPQ